MTTLNKLLLIATGFVIMAMVMLWYIRTTQQNLLQFADEQLNQQHLELQVIARLADRNQTDEAAHLFRIRCSSIDQKRLDTLLPALHTLGIEQLYEAKALVLTCGANPARSKTAMTMRLEAGVDHLEQLVAMREHLSFAPAVDLTTWSKLVETELDRAGLMRQQIELQLQIIDELIKGTAATAPSISASLTTAAGISTEYQKLNETVRSLHQTLGI